MEQLTSFDHLWLLLNPAPEYNRKKPDCQGLWNSLTLKKQHVVYRIIRSKKEKGERLHTNPFFALEDNINVEPTFLTGPQQDEAWADGKPLVMVKYRDRYAICTAETQQLFELEFVREWEKSKEERKEKSER
ncbi:MAG: hypothetical protein J5621_03815 [Paludibacteraceae bacterium]|nr:hypothetical protein [Paludibacteraceae bacterium]